MIRWLVLVCLACGVASARPGGGQSYSGGGRSYSSSSSGRSYSSGTSYSSSSSSSGGAGSMDGSGVLLALLLLMALFVIGGLVLNALPPRNDFDSQRAAGAPAPSPFELSIAQMREVDQFFSIAVFEDFAAQLYAAAQLARTDAARLATLAPYLSPFASGNLAARMPAVQHVVIGSLQIEGTQRRDDQLRLGVRVEANHILDADHTRFVVEHWMFVRKASVQTKPPVRARTWPCPECGAPWQAKLGEPFVCASCGSPVQAGRFDWAVEQIWIESDVGVGATLTGTVEERGTNSKTVVAPGTAETWKVLCADDPAVTHEAFVARIEMIYAQLNTAWNARDLAPVRGLLTGAMLDYLTYWTSQYKREHLTNHLDAAAVSGIDLAKVRRDPYFDAVTVRVYATGLDYTTNDQGSVVGGSKDLSRDYTEYWTFLRKSTRRGPITTTPACPNCGAPLAIADTGACTHCNAIVDSGDFDWVLSKIEQDEAYRG